MVTHIQVHACVPQICTYSSNRNGLAEIKLGKELKNKASTKLLLTPGYSVDQLM